MKGGGSMIDFDVKSVRIAMVRAVNLVVAVRRLAKPIGLDTEELYKLESEFRSSAGELMRVEKT
jgi:hypothetical protein